MSHHAPSHRLIVRRAVLLIAALALGLMSYTCFSSATSGAPKQAAAGSRVPWQGGAWYLHGANVPWLNWGCDFGCGTHGGVSDPAVTDRIDAIFKRAAESNVHVLRWWSFEGDAAQVTRDGVGAPSGLKPEVYADFDAALALAAKYDLYYVFTLFSAPTHVPSVWLTDPEQRQRLSATLGALFARYSDNRRILAWDIFNEPDWDIWSGKIAQDAVQATVQAIAGAVHANSAAYATVAAAMLDGLPHWTGLGLDFYTANWYDPMSSGNWCALCTDYAEVRARYNLDAPLVIGEFYAGSDINPRPRFEAWHAKGYAGALAWSLNPDATTDKLAIDLDAAAEFGRQHDDTGPRAPTQASGP